MTQKDQRTYKTHTVWAPIPKSSQVLFLNCPYNEVLYQGSRGGGKTDCMLMSYAKNVGLGFGEYWRGVIFRRSYKELDDIIAKSIRWFSQIFPTAHFYRGKGDYKWVFQDGEELQFRHMDNPNDYWNYHGQEYPFIGWEELTTWPDASCYESMFSCNRVSYSPDKVDRGKCKSCGSSTHWVDMKTREVIDRFSDDYVDDPSQLKDVVCENSECDFQLPKKCTPQIRSTTNPYGCGHSWVKQYFIDVDGYGPFKRFTDPKTLMTRCNVASNMSENPYLDEGYVGKMFGLSDLNKRDAWAYGSWDIVSGGMFSHVWNRETQVVKPFKIPDGWKIDRSFDWGNSKPFCTLWFAQSDGTDYKDEDGVKHATQRGSVYLIVEDYGWNGEPNKGIRATNKEIARRIKAIEKDNYLLKNRVVQRGPADTSIWTVENGSSIADDMRHEGVRWRKADKSRGSRKSGWNKIIQMLDNSTRMEGPGLFIFDSCNHALRLIPVTPRDEDDLDDIDTNAEDHLQDALRYRVRKRGNSATVKEMA